MSHLRHSGLGLKAQGLGNTVQGLRLRVGLYTALPTLELRLRVYVGNESFLHEVAISRVVEASRLRSFSRMFKVVGCRDFRVLGFVS